MLWRTGSDTLIGVLASLLASLLAALDVLIAALVAAMTRGRFTARGMNVLHGRHGNGTGSDSIVDSCEISLLRLVY